MESHSYDEMHDLQAKNWWYAARRELIRRLIVRSKNNALTVLDFGCGVGSNASALAATGRQIIGVDAAEQALERAGRLGIYTKLVRSSDENIPLPDSSVDLVLAADVLEHIDDVKALREMLRVLRPGGVLLVTVPAHRWLWNWNDDYSHHLRRYERNELLKRLTEAGFTVHKISAWNFTFVLPVFIVGMLQRMRMRPEHVNNNLYALPEWINGLLLRLMRVENWLFQQTGLPLGVSLAAVAEKP